MKYVLGLFLYLFTIFICIFGESNSKLKHPTRFTPILYDDYVKNPDKYSNLSMVTKCCPFGESMIEINGTIPMYECQHSEKEVDFSPKFCNSKLENHANPCKPYDNLYGLIKKLECSPDQYIYNDWGYDDFEPILHKNGEMRTLTHYQLTLAADKYCLNQNFNENNSSIDIFLCVSEYVDEGGHYWQALAFFISIPFYIATLVTYTTIPAIKTQVFSKTLCFYCLTHSIGTFFLACLKIFRMKLVLCSIVAFLAQFFLLTSFCWLNVMNIEIFQLIKHYKNTGNINLIRNKYLFLYYNIWAWIPSLIIVLTSIGIEYSSLQPYEFPKPNFENGCWFKTGHYFGAPLSVSVSINVLIFIITLLMIIFHQRQMHLRQDGNTPMTARDFLIKFWKFLVLSFILFFMLGVNWLIEVLGIWFLPDAPLIIDLINCGEGIFTFGIFVLHKPIRMYIWNRIKRIFGNDVDNEPQISSFDVSVISILKVDGITVDRFQ